MGYRKAAAGVLTLVCAFTILHAKPQEDFGSGAIKTQYGFMLVWNAPNNHYTLQIKGKNVRQTSTERVQFNVDGMFLQVLTSPIKDFLENPKNQTLEERAILEAHRNWELKFMEGDYKEKLKVDSSWEKLSNGKEALVWQIEVPASARSNVRKQISLTLVKGGYVLMLGGIVTDTIEESASRRLLLEAAETLKPSDKPIDLRKLQDSIRKEASTGSETDRTKSATLKGRIFRSDTKAPVPNASITLLDEKKSEKQDNSVDAIADESGNYIFPNVVAGSYTVSIRSWYKTQEEAPCQLLMAKTSDKDSMVTVARDKDRFVQQVFIKGFSVKAGKDAVRDFDFACRSLFVK